MSNSLCMKHNQYLFFVFFQSHHAELQLYLLNFKMQSRKHDNLYSLSGCNKAQRCIIDISVCFWTVMHIL